MMRAVGPITYCVLFPVLTGNYYAIGRATQHEAHVDPEDADPPPGKDGLTPQKKRSIKARPDDMFHTAYYETLGSVFDRREGEYHERTMADI
jgi:hypothetical protein